MSKRVVVGLDRVRAWAALKVCVLAYASIGMDCGPAGVGDPCQLEVEYDPQFPGFSVGEAYIESSSFECKTRVCLANHFQGRTTCPLGQSADDLLAPETDARRCRVPGNAEVVSVKVEPWDLDRPAHETVYCSCRCAGPDPKARYCDCPDGYSCTPLIPELRDSRSALLGSYCVREGTEFRAEHVDGPTCHDVPESPSCTWR